MSSPKHDIKERMHKLRSLRDKLCSKGTDWKDGFAARDYLVSEMETMKDMLENPKVNKKEVLVKLKSVLDLLSPGGG